MRLLAIAALVLLTGCAADFRPNRKPAGAFKRPPMTSGMGQKSDYGTFNNRFGRWRKITVDMWIPNKGDLK